ncbi:hypothetical protein ADINL_0547 [Nitrincola lacisaponensis]|uniref:DUF4123 domain-containing protein n=1 Tax=Nitrincola lacisaponensis TaxID=267850 RepID=A0A063Y3L9_9GAMM|nr:DUF4123 domain-containing protein [Nitrincola lacisaponensis]KDE40898.1 hypothetical protein ADINL_0547 [Nitrincola lacisaponensis]
MNYIPWVGQCFLRALSIDDRNSYVVLAAVWAADRESFLEAARDALASQHYTLYWADNVMPANQWIRQQGPDPEAISLARRVSPEHPVELGEVQRHQKDTTDIKTEDWLKHQVLGKVKPLDAQLGTLDPLSVPPSLHPYLFEVSPPSLAEQDLYKNQPQVPPLRTYAVLDTSRVPLLLERLEEANLPFQCLFKGDAEESLKTAAPYLVELKENHKFTRQLFSKTGMASDLWDRYPGVYFRSRALIDQLATHFRRFTKVKNEQGKWLFYRFWDSNFFLVVLKQLSPAKGLAIMPPHLIHSMLCISMDGIDFFKTQSLENIPNVGCELILDDTLYAELHKRSLELFVYRLRQQYVDEKGMNEDLFSDVMSSVELYQFGERETIRKIFDYALAHDENLLGKEELTEELTEKQSMPDSIRLGRLMIKVNRSASHDAP